MTRIFWGGKPMAAQAIQEPLRETDDQLGTLLDSEASGYERNHSEE